MRTCSKVSSGRYTALRDMDVAILLKSAKERLQKLINEEEDCRRGHPQMKQEMIQLRRLVSDFAKIMEDSNKQNVIRKSRSHPRSGFGLRRRAPHHQFCDAITLCLYLSNKTL